MIGQCGYRGFDFTTLDRKLLYKGRSGTASYSHIVVAGLVVVVVAAAAAVVGSTDLFVSVAVVIHPLFASID